MNYKEFIEEVKNCVQAKMGGAYVVEVHNVTKNNGLVLDGLTITKRESSISPTIYLNPYYHKYENGMGIKAITEEIYGTYHMNFKNMPEEIKTDLSKFDEIKDRIVYKIIRRQGNEQLLSDIPSTSYLDLEIVYYLLISKDVNEQITALISNKCLKLWGVTIEKIHELAVSNSERILPSKIMPIEDVLLNMLSSFGEADDELTPHCNEIDKSRRLEHPLFVLSNTTGQNGAAAILYEGVLDKFSNEMEADIVIIPSSIHETLLLPFTEIFEPDELRDMVRTINSTLEVEDVLSDNIYIYRRELRKIQFIE